MYANSVSLECRNNDYVENTSQCSNGQCALLLLFLFMLMLIWAIHCNLFCMQQEALQMNTTVGLIGPVDSTGSKHMPAYSVNRNLCPIICCHFFRPSKTSAEDAGNLWWALDFVSISQWPVCVCLGIYTMLNTFVYDRRRDTYVYFNECQEEAEEQTHKHFALSKSIFHWRSTLTHHSCGCALVTMLTD